MDKVAGNSKTKKASSARPTNNDSRANLVAYQRHESASDTKKALWNGDLGWVDLECDSLLMLMRASPCFIHF